MIFFRKKTYMDFLIIPLPEEIDFFRNFPMGKIISLDVELPCVWGPCAVVSQIPLCAGHVLWCVETLNRIFSQIFLCMGTVLWCVKTLNVFTNSTVWGPYALVCRDCENFYKFPCVSFVLSCAETLRIFLQISILT